MRVKKFTEGKYVTRYNGSFFEIKTDGGSCIAEVFHDDRTVETSLPKYNEARANAALISAAPELLEACENLLAYLETDDMKPLDMNLARTAIAKAYGE